MDAAVESYPQAGDPPLAGGQHGWGRLPISGCWRCEIDRLRGHVQELLAAGGALAVQADWTGPDTPELRAWYDAAQKAGT